MTIVEDPILSSADDAEIRAFLLARLSEERDAALEHPRHVRGLDVLDEVVDQLRAGSTPDQMTCDLLLVAYAGHTDFQEQWNRWRPGASGYLGWEAGDA